MINRGALDVVLDALMWLASLTPGLWALWAALSAIMDWPPPYTPRDWSPLWATPADRLWIVPAMILLAGWWFWFVSRGWPSHLGDRGTAQR